MEEIYCNVWDEDKKNTIKNIIEDCIKGNICDQAVYIAKQLKKINPETRWSVLCIHVNKYYGLDLNVHAALLICYIKNELIIIYPRKALNNPEDDSKESIDKKKFEEQIKKYESIIKEQKSKLDKIIMQNELLQKTLKEKKEEIINLKNEIQKKQENNSFNKTFYTREQMIALNFISSDSTLHYAIPCLNKDLFVDVEKKLYDKFPEYKERNNNFLSQGKIVLKFKTVGENRLESGIPIIMQAP